MFLASISMFHRSQTNATRTNATQTVSPPATFYTLRKKCYWIYSISAKSMYTIDSKKYLIKNDTYVTNSIAFWFKSIINMFLAEMLYVDSIAFFLSVAVVLCYSLRALYKSQRESRITLASHQHLIYSSHMSW